MRDVFVKELMAHACIDKRVMLVTGDLGFGVLNDYSTGLPNQFINAGVAEQNMAGVAAGLAFEGRNVFTYSIANFPTFRCLEQIRNDILYHDLSVNIVAIGGGFSYGSLGMSHHATEDVAVMRAMPGLRLFAPCDDIETAAIVAQMVEDPAPSYLRLDKSKVSRAGFENFTRGKLRQMRQGEDVALVSYGGIVSEAMLAADYLAELGISCSVYSAHTIKPFDSETMLNLARTYPTVATIEEHIATGGLGSLAADIFLDAHLMPNKFTKFCLPDSFSSIVGSQEYLRHCYGLDAKSIAESLSKLVDR